MAHNLDNYPVNSLKPMLRDPKENLSAFKVLRDALIKVEDSKEKKNES